MRLVRAAIILVLALLVAGCGSGGKAAPPAGKAAVKGFGQLVANNADQVDAADVAGKAGIGLAASRQAKTELQSGSSGLMSTLDEIVAEYKAEEYQAALKAACKANDTYEYTHTTSEEDQRNILRSQGETPEAKMTATLALAKQLYTMKNTGTEREKAAASIICWKWA